MTDRRALATCETGYHRLSPVVNEMNQEVNLYERCDVEQEEHIHDRPPETPSIE